MPTLLIIATVFLGVAVLFNRRVRETVLKINPVTLPLVIKKDVRLAGLSDVMEQAKQAANTVMFELSGDAATITSGLDGVHGPSSLHFKGLALDFRRIDWPTFAAMIDAKKQADRIREELPDDFDVVLEPTHIHVEFDPKVRVA